MEEDESKAADDLLVIGLSMADRAWVHRFDAWSRRGCKGDRGQVLVYLVALTRRLGVFEMPGGFTRGCARHRGHVPTEGLVMPERPSVMKAEACAF